MKDRADKDRWYMKTLRKLRSLFREDLKWYDVVYQLLKLTIKIVVIIFLSNLFYNKG